MLKRVDGVCVLGGYDIALYALLLLADAWEVMIPLRIHLHVPICRLHVKLHMHIPSGWECMSCKQLHCPSRRWAPSGVEM